MKKTIFAILIALTLTLTFGCINSTGSFVVRSCISNQDKDSFSMSYENFNGYKTYSFKSEAGAALSARFVSESGTLSCVVADADGNEYYRNDNVTSDELTIPLGAKGKYYVTLRASDHKGAFYFNII